MITRTARLLQRLGAEARLFDPRDLPLPDSVPADHPKAAELRALSLWSEGQVWVSPERHGTLTGILKCQIDWLPLESGGVRPTQGRTLAMPVMTTIALGALRHASGCPDARRTRPSISLAQPL